MSDTYKDFLKNSETLANRIESQFDEVLGVLLHYETLTTAKDEANRSIETLNGFRDEFDSVNTAEDQLHVSTFFPLNLPLYSLVLFAIAPAAFAEAVHVRAPANMLPILNELATILHLHDLFPAVHIFKSERADFLNHYVKQSDVVLFTGKYENALAIQKECPHALFLYNGSGVNPAIVYEDADVELAADKIFEMRTFNSGQDCAGTDAIFVSSKVVERFTQKLISLCNNAVVGEYGSTLTEIGPILRSQYISELKGFIAAESDHVVLDGSIDDTRNLVSPFIFKRDLRDHTGEFHEFFAPVFNILTFEEEEEVLSVLASPPVKEYSMYVTYFSQRRHLDNIRFARLLRNQIVNDVESGNEAYGGYGSKANFTSHDGVVESKPILISAEITEFIRSNISEPFTTN